MRNGVDATALPGGCRILTVGNGGAGGNAGDVVGTEVVVIHAGIVGLVEPDICHLSHLACGETWPSSLLKMSLPPRVDVNTRQR